MLTERFDKAVNLALQLHRKQKRKGGNVPYASHLLRTAGLVMEFAARNEETAEDAAIAAVLHDAVEDQGGLATAKLIREQFGERVEKFVLECSDSTEAKGQPKRPWRERKEKSIAKIKTVASESRLIIACDKLDNLRSMIYDYRIVGERLWERFNAGPNERLWYYYEMINALRNAGDCPIIAELEECIKTLENFMKEKF